MDEFARPRTSGYQCAAAELRQQYELIPLDGGSSRLGGGRLQTGDEILEGGVKVDLGLHA
jgi:hypothetical protein